MINISDHILKFRNFLINSWSDLDLLMSNHDWDDDEGFTLDWLQVNWEFLVEKELLGKGNYLMSYFNTESRITNPDAKPNYRVICKLLGAENEKLTLFFGGFEAKTKGGYGIYPPFDYVNVFIDTKRNSRSIPVNECAFFIIPVEM